MSEQINIAICGGTGYTGLELIKILQKRADINIKIIGANQNAGQNFKELFPEIGIDLICSRTDKVFIDKLESNDLDFVFFATPNGVAHKLAPVLKKKNIHVIDLSADYRFRDLKIYQEVYEFKRPDKEANKEAVYGLVEFKKNQILEILEEAKKNKQGLIIGNPGCYTTSSILALAPLLEYAKENDPDLLDLNSIIVDGKSGISGAGRKAELSLIYTELNESCSPYNLGGKHRHGPELEAFFSEISDSKIPVTFSPHLVPMTRGLLTSNYINFKKDFTEEKLREIYQNRYANSKNIKVLDENIYPKTSWACHNNDSFIQTSFDKKNKRAIITCAIDNLVKGAAGQAIENMDLIISGSKS